MIILIKIFATIKKWYWRLRAAAPPQITVHKEIEKPLFSLTLGCKAEDLGCKVKDIKE